MDILNSEQKKNSQRNFGACLAFVYHDSSLYGFGTGAFAIWISYSFDSGFYSFLLNLCV